MEGSAGNGLSYVPALETVSTEGAYTATGRHKIPSPTPGPPAMGIDLFRQPSGRSLSKVASADMSAASEGLVDRLDSASSAIKAVSSQPAVAQAPPYNMTATAAPRPLPRHAHAAAQGQAQHAEEILVAPSPARRQSSRASPLKGGSSSGGISLDGAAARSGARATSSGSSPAKKAARSPTRDLDRMHVEQQAPARFICPISGRVMRDPVILVTGTTCDRASMEGWLAKGHKSCPVTRQLLKKPIHLVPNVEMRNHITTWAAKNAPWMVDREKQLRSNVPDRLEALGCDPQYVMPLKDDSEAPAAADASGGGRSDSRSLGRAGRQWEYTADGKLVSKDVDGRSKVIDVKANGGAEERATPWRTSRGLRSQPRDSADSARSGRSKRPKRVRDWYSAAFLAVISLAYVALFIASLGKGGWKPAPMSVNPWFGADAEALAGVGAAVLPLMEGPGKQWWRLVTAPFLPAGLVHLAISAAGLWGYGRYAQMALPLPQVSVAGVYLLPALIASLASANLNTAFLTCGATAGTCALLGTVAADQAVNFRRKKLFNLKEWWLVALILVINAAAFIVLSLMPMTDPWFPAVGLIAGFLMSTILLTLRRVGKGRPGNRRWAATQIVCALVLVCATTACIVGCVVPSKVGQKVPALKSAACVDLRGRWWECVPYGSLRNGCALAVAAGGNATLTCPATGAQVAVPGAGPAQMANSTALAALCDLYCAEAPPPTTGILPIDSSAAGQAATAPTADALAAAGPPPAAAAAGPAIGTPPTDPTATVPPTVPTAVPTTAAPAVSTPVTVPTTVVPSAVSSSPLPQLIYVPSLPLGRKLRAGEDREEVPRQLHPRSTVHSVAGRKLHAGRRRP